MVDGETVELGDGCRVRAYKASDIIPVPALRARAARVGRPPTRRVPLDELFLVIFPLYRHLRHERHIYGH